MQPVKSVGLTWLQEVAKCMNQLDAKYLNPVDSSQFSFGSLNIDGYLSVLSPRPRFKGRYVSCGYLGTGLLTSSIPFPQLVFRFFFLYFIF